MIGVAKSVVTKYGNETLLRLLGRRSTAKGVYARANDDRTAPLPLTHHMARVAAGFTLVEITSEGGMLDPTGVAGATVAG